MFNTTNPFEIFDFQKMLSAAKMPNLDVNSEGLINAQKKNYGSYRWCLQSIF